MKKLFFMMFVVMMVGFMVSPAMAGQINGDIKGHNTINNSNHVTNDYTDNSVTNQGGVGIGVGIGGKAKAEANNKNVNVNKVDNRDVNVNLVHQGQGQDQKQDQFQGQGQAMVFKQTFEDKRDHIQGPEVLKSDVKLMETKKFHAKIKGSIWDRVNGMSYKQAKKIWNGVSDSDVEVKTAILFERDYQTTYINKGESGEFMGTLYVSPTGTDVSVAGMEAKAAMIAIQLGATHMKRSYFGTGSYAGGSSWNVGIGGGASVMSDGDDVAVAPNGGLGFGKAKAFNEMLPEMTFTLYSDEAFLKNLNK